MLRFFITLVEIMKVRHVPIIFFNIISKFRQQESYQNSILYFIPIQLKPFVRRFGPFVNPVTRDEK